MRYYVTAITAESKLELLDELANVVLDAEPGSLRNILITCTREAATVLEQNSKVQAVELHPDDVPGLEVRVF